MQQCYWWFWQVLIIKRVSQQGYDFKTCSPFSSLYFDGNWSSDNISNQHNVLNVSNEISLSHMSFCPFSWVWLWKRAQTRPYEETWPCLTTSAKKKHTNSDANFSRRKHFLFRYPSRFKSSVWNYRTSWIPSPQSVSCVRWWSTLPGCQDFTITMAKSLDLSI